MTSVVVFYYYLKILEELCHVGRLVLTPAMHLGADLGMQPCNQIMLELDIARIKKFVSFLLASHGPI